MLSFQKTKGFFENPRDYQLGSITGHFIQPFLQLLNINRNIAIK